MGFLVSEMGLLSLEMKPLICGHGECGIGVELFPCAEKVWKEYFSMGSAVETEVGCIS